MIKGLIGRKLGMTQLFDEAKGVAIPVTVLEVGPCPVVQVKTREKDGYEAVQVGFGHLRNKKGEVKMKNVTKPLQGHFKKVGVEPTRVLQEFEPLESGKLPAPADVIDVSVFDGIGEVDIVGTSKGKGFQGVMKRHRMSGGPDTHGSNHHRRVGSIGMRMTPGEVGKGHRMPGHMGNARVTARGLKIERIDREKNLLFVKGSVPGPRSGLVYVYHGLKN